MPTIASTKTSFTPPHANEPWTKDRFIGQKPPLKLKEIWAIRIRLQIMSKLRDLAMFNLAIDSNSRSCDLVALRVDDIALGGGSDPEQSSSKRRPSDRFNSS